MHVGVHQAREDDQVPHIRQGGIGHFVVGANGIDPSIRDVNGRGSEGVGSQYSSAAEDLSSHGLFLV